MLCCISKKYEKFYCKNHDNFSNFVSVSNFCSLSNLLKKHFRFAEIRYILQKQTEKNTVIQDVQLQNFVYLVFLKLSQ